MLKKTDMDRTSYRISISIFRAGLFFILFSYACVNALQAAENTSDIFGYRWTDNKYSEPTIVANWMDATETGNLIEFDKDESQTVALGFDFNFYGNIYSTITISSNGYLTFGSIGNIATNSSIPNPSEPNNIIAPFWDDLTCDWLYSDYQEVYYKTIGSEPNRKFVVEWYDSIVSNNSDSNITFEVILEEQTNRVVAQLVTP
ncbi:MAG: hypothetical protein U9N60_09215 [Thermodesulfobacteriota bacterium]|nr:hypothetical protein [Thermodesulfobacteriota bacterium]